MGCVHPQVLDGHADVASSPPSQLKRLAKRARTCPDDVAIPEEAELFAGKALVLPDLTSPDVAPNLSEPDALPDIVC